jgi:DNA-directed RNA polymerase specialized sigma24 family protein
MSRLPDNLPFGTVPCFESHMDILGGNGSVDLSGWLSIPCGDHYRVPTSPAWKDFSMSHDNSVTHWLDGARAGDDADIQRLWDRYFQRLVQLASSRMPRHARRMVDEEDIAISAFRSFCDRVGKGQFPDLADRDQLWRVLFAITVRKVVGSVRYQTREKRGGGRVLGESGMGVGNDPLDQAGISRFLSREPTPAAAAQFADELEGLFSRLDDVMLRVIAFQKLQGMTPDEIAGSLEISKRTVDRKLRLIRALWEEEPSCAPR